MIYKFIDNNGAEITVNSLSSLEALIDSETVKENTQVKAGLRGKWTAAINIDELKDLFNKQVEEIAEPEIPEEDIKSFITKEEPVEQEAIPKPIIKNEVVAADTSVNDANIDAELEVSESNIENIYDNNNRDRLNFFESIEICFKKYFNFTDRASRSEFWYFILFGIIGDFITGFFDVMILDIPFVEMGPINIIYSVAITIPSIAVTTRRLHDVNKSGWWQLIVITIVGIIPLLIWYCTKGENKINRFGNYPLQLKKNK
jgi:uncharacterized membrane protein YhaH (DUF805 family)